MVLNSMNIVSGFKEIDFLCWSDFSNFIISNNNLKGYIFRGQSRKQYLLLPSLFRTNPKISLSEIDKHLHKFKMSIRGRIEIHRSELEDEDAVWAIGQHFGLKTPLLDWTASPFVAAYFAFEGERKSDFPPETKGKSFSESLKILSDEPASIFALNARKLNELYYAAFSVIVTAEHMNTFSELRPMLSSCKTDDDILGVYAYFEKMRYTKSHFSSDKVEAFNVIDHRVEKGLPKIVSPISGENKRLISQRGIFTKQIDGKPIENWANQFGGDNTGNLLLKINLPYSLKHDVLMHLDAANVNHLSIFPDLIGAAGFCNSRL
jgi:hypothetical protein